MARHHHHRYFYHSEGTKRNARTVATAIKVGLRYGRALRQLRSQFKVEGDLHLVTEPERYEDFLSPVHEASAQDIAKLCQENGTFWFWIKQRGKEPSNELTHTLYRSVCLSIFWGCWHPLGVAI